MKRLLFIAFMALSLNAFAQTNNYPTTGDVTIYNYSPSLILQRNTTDGGFTEGIQTRLQDGTDNWYFGALHTGQWVVSKGNYANRKMTVLENGNIGIGITDPQAKLDVFKNGTLNGNDLIANFKREEAATGGSGIVRIGNHNSADLEINSGYSSVGHRFGTYADFNIVNNQTGGAYGAINFVTNGTTRMTINPNGNIGIGTMTPASKLDLVENNQHLTFLLNQRLAGNWPGTTEATTMTIQSSGVSAGNLAFATGNSEAMRITANSYVGIGIANPAYKLDVLGTIRAKEVLVNLDGGADFVFEKDYKLPSIEHVANYVQENKHLPDIPTANKMVKNGVSMGDMQVKLLQKVEELTLYAIQQNRKIEAIQKENEQYKAERNNLLTEQAKNIAEQQRQLSELKKEIDALKKK